MAKKSLSLRTVKAAKPPAQGSSIIWDTTVRGFGLRTYPTGAKKFIFRYRLRARTRWHVLGEYPGLDPADAREAAMMARAQVAKGLDPAAEAKKAKARTKTLRDIADDYMSRASLKPSTRDSYENYIRHVLARFEDLSPAEITEDDIEAWFRPMARREPYGANRRLWMLSKLMDEAERLRIRKPGTNPCRHIKRAAEAERSRYLSDKEFARIGEALRKLEDEGKVSTHAAAAIRLLMFTGARKSEILNLRWKDVDLERRRLVIPDHKTSRKTRKPRVLPVSAPAAQLLAELPRTKDHPFVIEGQLKKKPLTTIQVPWRRVLQEAKIEERTRLHDIRHSVASNAVDAGMSLPLIGALLGHRSAQSTERYAHLSDDPVRKAAESVSAGIAAALEGKVADEHDFEAEKRQRA